LQRGFGAGSAFHVPDGLLETSLILSADRVIALQFGENGFRFENHVAATLELESLKFADVFFKGHRSVSLRREASGFGQGFPS
jgi:hypothetical protein